MFFIKIKPPQIICCDYFEQVLINLHKHNILKLKAVNLCPIRSQPNLQSVDDSPILSLNQFHVKELS